MGAGVILIDGAIILVKVKVAGDGTPARKSMFKPPKSIAVLREGSFGTGISTVTERCDRALGTITASKESKEVLV
jgi:hypothetical protein